jgi:hypothetical protein
MKKKSKFLFVSLFLIAGSFVADSQSCDRIRLTPSNIGSILGGGTSLTPQPCRYMYYEEINWKLLVYTRF